MLLPSKFAFSIMQKNNVCVPSYFFATKLQVIVYFYTFFANEIDSDAPFFNIVL